MHKSIQRGGSKKVSSGIRLAKLAFFRYNVAYLRKKSLPILLPEIQDILLPWYSWSVVSSSSKYGVKAEI